MEEFPGASGGVLRKGFCADILRRVGHFTDIRGPSAEGPWQCNREEGGQLEEVPRSIREGSSGRGSVRIS